VEFALVQDEFADALSEVRREQEARRGSLGDGKGPGDADGFSDSAKPGDSSGEDVKDIDIDVATLQEVFSRLLGARVG
jgi:hypothetical protein